MDGQEHRERPEGETGDLGKRGNGWKNGAPGSLRDWGRWNLGNQTPGSRVGSSSRACTVERGVLGPGWRLSPET